MIVGRRSNVDMSKTYETTNTTTTRSLFHAEDVEIVAKKFGKLFMTCAEDYFFVAGGFDSENSSDRDSSEPTPDGNRTSSFFPWHRFADVVVGRSAYDNYLVAMAIQLNVSVVDATDTLTALHQTDSGATGPGIMSPAGGSIARRSDASISALGRPLPRSTTRGPTRRTEK